MALHALASVLHAARAHSLEHLAALQQQFTDAGGLQPLLAELARLSSCCAASEDDDDDAHSWQHRCLATSLMRAVSELCRGGRAQQVLLGEAGEHVVVIQHHWRSKDSYVVSYGLHIVAQVMQVGWRRHGGAGYLQGCRDAWPDFSLHTQVFLTLCT
jgi:hypothetical protein